MFSVAAWKARRNLIRGYRAWLSGDLDGALRLLDGAARGGHCPAGDLYAARVLSELGKKEEALARIDASLAATSRADPVARVFRAIILFDHEDPVAARDSIAPLVHENVIAAAVEALIVLRETISSRSGEDGAPPREARIRMPLAASWTADVMGRCLAILEIELHRRHPEEALDLQFEETPEEAKEAGGPAEKELQPPAGWRRRWPFRRRNEGRWREAWRRRFDAAFDGRNYLEIEALVRREDAPEDWLDAERELCRAFAWMALGKEARALQHLARIEEGPSPPRQLPLVRSLCHARAGRFSEACWGFTRVARATDLDADELIRRISARLGVSWDHHDGLEPPRASVAPF